MNRYLVAATVLGLGFAVFVVLWSIAHQGPESLDDDG